MRQDSPWRNFGNNLAKNKTGDSNARCYTASDDYHELYDVIKPKLQQDVCNHDITPEERDRIWDICTKAYWRRRTPFTVKTKSIYEEATGHKFGE